MESTMDIFVKKTGQTVQVSDDLPEVSREFLFQYGVKQWLNDRHASLQSKDFNDRDEYVEKVMGRVLEGIDKLESGEVPGTKAPATSATAKRLAKAIAADPAILAKIEALLNGHTGPV
jgi:hypothetical protein